MAKMQMSRTAVVALLTKLLAGILKYIPTPIPVGGSTMSAAQMNAVLNACLQAGADLDAAKVVHENKLVAYRAAYEAAHALWVALIAYLRAAYGSDNPILAEFGVTPHVRAQPSAATKLAALAKARATRALRHTMGSRQKKALSEAAATVPPAPAPKP